MEIHAIVAIDQNNAIGKEGKLPWHLPSELQHFKSMTMGYPMILGRTTFESFKKPLPGRDHLVLSSKEIPQQERVFTFKSKEDVFNFCAQKKYEKVFVCGGASIYQLFSEEIDHWHISQIHLKIEGADTFFKSLNYSKFNLLHQENHPDWTYNYYQRSK